jgi:hypothetical protein
MPQLVIGAQHRVRKAVGLAIRITVPAPADLDRLLGVLDAVSRAEA